MWKSARSAIRFTLGNRKSLETAKQVDKFRKRYGS